jgi:hypothetical protein
VDQTTVGFNITLADFWKIARHASGLSNSSNYGAAKEFGLGWVNQGLVESSPDGLAKRMTLVIYNTAVSRNPGFVRCPNTLLGNLENAACLCPNLEPVVASSGCLPPSIQGVSQHANPRFFRRVDKPEKCPSSLPCSCSKSCFRAYDGMACAYA